MLTWCEDENLNAHASLQRSWHRQLTDEEGPGSHNHKSSKATTRGIDHRVGSSEVGKDGDLAIFNNHPLSIDALPMVTIVDGVVRFDREKMM